MQRHLEKKHPSVNFKAVQEEQSNVQAVLQTVPIVQLASLVTAEEFNGHLMKLILTKNLPFSLVESKEFKALIDYCSLANPNCTTLSSKTFAKRVNELYDSEKAALKEEIKNSPGKVSFCVDGWKSSNKIPYQGVVATWMNVDWEIQTVVIDLARLRGLQSAENVTSSFCQTLDDFDLWSKLLAVTTDNESKMKSFASKLEPIAARKGVNFKATDNHIPCLAHIINLSCQEILKSIGGGKPMKTNNLEIDSDEDDSEDLNVGASLYSKARNGIAGINTSTIRIDAYEDFCTKFNCKKLSLVLDVSTRWNSTLKMFQRLKCMKKPYQATVKKFTELKDCELSNSEWAKIDAIIDLLKPFEQATIKMSTNRSPTISNTSACYHLLFKHLETYTSPVNNSKHPDWIVTAAKMAWFKLQKYYPTTEGLVCVAATSKFHHMKFSYLYNL